jgi:hypothetical protein
VRVGVAEHLRSKECAALSIKPHGNQARVHVAVAPGTLGSCVLDALEH